MPGCKLSLRRCSFGPADECESRSSRYAEHPGQKEGKHIGSKFVAADTCTECHYANTELVCGKNPAKHHGPDFSAKGCDRQFYSGWNGGNKIQTVDDSESHHGDQRDIAGDGLDKRYSAEAIVIRKKPAVVVAIGKPA